MLLITDVLAPKVMHSRPSDCFHSTFEPSDLWPWPYVHVWVMTLALLEFKVKVRCQDQTPSQGQKSERSQLDLNL